MEPEKPEAAADRILYAVADAFMVLMLSRPSTGSLRVTRVTTVSLALSLAAAVALTAVAGLILAGGFGPGRGIISALLLALALGSLSVAVVALRQRVG